MKKIKGRNERKSTTVRRSRGGWGVCRFLYHTQYPHYSLPNIPATKISSLKILHAGLWPVVGLVQAFFRLLHQSMCADKFLLGDRFRFHPPPGNPSICS